MKKEGRGSGGRKDTNKGGEGGAAAIQTQTMKVLVEAESSRQILRESFQAKPPGGGKTRTSTCPQPLHLSVAVGLLLGCLVGHHKEEFPGLP